LEVLCLVVRIDQIKVTGKISETKTEDRRKVASTRYGGLEYGANDPRALKMYRRASVVDVVIKRRKGGRGEGGRKEGRRKERRKEARRKEGRRKEGRKEGIQIPLQPTEEQGCVMAVIVVTYNSSGRLGFVQIA
jgi:hypothetical protein